MTGELATSKAGHDKHRLYLVVKEDDESVYLCDGRLRGVTNPKKKKKKHIQIIHYSLPTELLQRAANATCDTEDGINEEIRMSLEGYLKNIEIRQCSRILNIELRNNK